MQGKRFAAKHADKLIDPARREILRAEEIVNLLLPGFGGTIADIGAGNGYFSIPLASRAARVNAMDIEPRMLEMLRLRAEQADINNITYIGGTAEDIPLDDNSQDAVLFAFVYHEVDYPVKVLQEIKRILRPGGRAVIADWGEKVRELGPPQHERLEAEEVQKDAAAAEFSVVHTEIRQDVFWVELKKEMAGSP
ncbi:class I SAM-dependent methyltransferase [Alkalicoccus halolimnae]|uniref:Class I SAM-dependent methyltransferase n=1 Tax=Alkalicoccus halolimnae TaxID=1667239 RepID=A0A5C7FIV6_9BACI|nr:class I SAM-dependent methyltransferase [Alkalicoccus halolimnae]TXF84299.1 class I SAM-dependent methyltransferase [Alkalicoccus halolimnae]